jgi:quinol monooxygenase YgiN
MNIEYGFQATMTAKEGKADELVDLLLSGPTVGPSAHEGCLVFLVSRSATQHDVVHLVEGWVSEQVHHGVFDDPESQGYIARCAELVADSQYTDFVPLGGKANLAHATSPSATGR